MASVTVTTRLVAPAVEPAIEGVRADRLHDVARAHDGARRGGEAIGEGGEPVLLAAVHVHDVGVGQPAEQRPQIARVACRRARRSGTRASRCARRRSRARDRSRGPRCPLADERRRMPGALELGADARGPVRVRRPPAARHEVEHPHGRTALRLPPSQAAAPRQELPVDRLHLLRVPLGAVSLDAPGGRPASPMARARPGSATSARRARATDSG